MDTASLKQLKSQLELQSHESLVNICIRLGKFKADNKDLLTYLLFEASDEENYIHTIKSKIDNWFEELNTTHLYIAKKNLRKIIRLTGKYIKYTNEPDTAIRVQIHLLHHIRTSGIDFSKSKVIDNMRMTLEKKIQKLIAQLHEDLQFDYNKMLAIDET